MDESVDGVTTVYREPGSLLVYSGPFVARVVWRNGRMGYHRRWRWLSPITTRAKIVLNRCDLCLRTPRRCRCPEFDHLTT